MTTRSRTYAVDLPKLTQLRMERGWSEEQLAIRSGTSLKTVRSIHLGKPCYLATLKKLATCLDVPVLSLMRADDNTIEPPSADRTITLVFNFKLPMDEFDETEHIGRALEQIGSRMRRQPNIEVRDIEPGSVLVATLVDRDTLGDIFDAYCRGELDGMSLDKLSIYDPDSNLPALHSFLAARAKAVSGANTQLAPAPLKPAYGPEGAIGEILTTDEASRSRVPVMAIECVRLATETSQDAGPDDVAAVDEFRASEN